MNERPENLFSDLEQKLSHLTEPLPRPEIGDWLDEHCEKGQTFRQYLSANPVRRNREFKAIHLCLIGDFTDPQEMIANLTREYLALLYDVPVHVRCRVPVSVIPAEARRKHPEWGDKQLLTTYILRTMLEPDRPDDALAYLALTTRDLWPGDGWNFVYGQANLRRRIGVWSLYRNGYPGKSEKTFHLCLRRTLSIAAHETGHILTMKHCTAFLCLMNGCNNRKEHDRQPLHLCPVCLRKLLWNLQCEPIPYLRRLESFCRDHSLAEADWYASATTALQE